MGVRRIQRGRTRQLRERKAVKDHLADSTDGAWLLTGSAFPARGERASCDVHALLAKASQLCLMSTAEGAFICGTNFSKCISGPCRVSPVESAVGTCCLLPGACPLSTLKTPFGVSTASPRCGGFVFLSLLLPMCKILRS